MNRLQQTLQSKIDKCKKDYAANTKQAVSLGKQIEIAQGELQILIQKGMKLKAKAQACEEMLNEPIKE